MPERKKEWYEKPLGMAVIMGIMLVGVIGFSVAVTQDTKEDKKPVAVKVQPKKKSAPAPPKATYQAEVINYGAPDPATLTVLVKLRNTNNTAGNPACKVEAKSTNGTYHGWDSFDLGRTVPAGGEDQFIGKMTITKEGSAYITSASATCGI
jgi:hypothetical protein